ncbi:hypothetical protein Tco_1066907 [Tanacetum coccineum]|uniref:Uncharacterized protein n=1 Tax=Tanacetum coccineum TaxID=301880 RepID=A0ABQ5HBC8_9ASTR
MNSRRPIGIGCDNERVAYLYTLEVFTTVKASVNSGRGVMMNYGLKRSGVGEKSKLGCLEILRRGKCCYRSLELRFVRIMCVVLRLNTLRCCVTIGNILLRGSSLASVPPHSVVSYKVQVFGHLRPYSRVLALLCSHISFLYNSLSFPYPFAQLYSPIDLYSTQTKRPLNL